MDCLLGERKRCTDVDVWFRCAPAEAMAKLARIYEACAEVVAGIGSCKNLLVTRTTYSLTILTSDRSITPLQVPSPPRQRRACVSVIEEPIMTDEDRR